MSQLAHNSNREIPNSDFRLPNSKGRRGITSTLCAGLPTPHRDLFHPALCDGLLTPHQRHSRRGITLLFVISMIVLFLLMGTTFVVVSNDYLRGARRRNINGGVNAGAITREEGQRLVLESFYDVVRGPSLDNVDNPLRTHDLLGDMYGYGIRATISGVPTRYRGNDTPFLRMTLTGPESLLTDSGTTFETIPGHYAGQLLTVTSGDFNRMTTRIIQHNISGGTHTLIVHPIGGTQDISGSLAAMNGATVIINGKAFAGTGAGKFNEAAAINVAALDGQAVLPNRVDDLADDLRDDYLVRTVGGVDEPNHSSVNEPWDAVDFQNLMLAGIVDANDNEELEADEITPSFFRESLAGADDFAAFDRLATDTGDGRTTVVVDNDNDGIADGLWIDTGLPIRSTPEGEYIKPLVSFLIMDLDGRLNLNAHDCLSDGTPQYTEYVGGAASVDSLPLGSGYGPAEVSLGPLLDDGTTATLSQDLLRVRYGRDVAPGDRENLDGKARYRLAGYPDGFTGRLFGSPVDLYGRAGLGFLNTTSGVVLEAAMPGFSDFVTAPTDPAVSDQLEDSPYEVNLLESGNAVDRLFTAMDLERVLRPDDRDSVLLGDRLLEVDPDDLNLREDPNDATSLPVFANENEKVINRLLEDSTTLTDEQKEFARKLLTTHSYEVPAIPEDINRLLHTVLSVPATDEAATLGELLSPEIRRGLPMNINRIFGDGVDNNGNGVIDEPGELENQLDGIGTNRISLDVDNDGDDDSGETVSTTDSPGLQARQNFARRLFVLMVLLTELPNRTGDINDPSTTGYFAFDGSGGAPDEEDLLAHRRMLAQWCVNVVDFRDRDSIMTPFEVDLNPFDGWDVDGDLATTTDSAGVKTPGDESAVLRDFLGTGKPSYFVAWGAERPELLITETTAFHDVRTQDLNNETAPTQGNASRTDDFTTPDEEYDSRFVPNASAFFELYNPWTLPTAGGVGSTQPAELYNGGGVDLTLTVGGGGTEVPVWRLLVFDPNVGNQAVRAAPETLNAGDLRDSVELEQEVDDAVRGNTDAVVRIAYFTQPGTSLTDPQFTDPRVYYPAGAAVSGSGGILGPGEFAVVGSSGVNSGSTFTTYIGRTSNDASPANIDTPSEFASTQQFVLEPSSDDFTTYATGTAGAEISHSDVAIALNTNGAGDNRSFGITDPRGGYEAAAAAVVPGVTVSRVDDGFQFDDGTGVPLTLDVPIDQSIHSADWPNHPLNHRGLISGYRVVYLQRLANPLIPFNADTNPYRIVDSSSIDLFVFNGLVDRSTETGAGVSVMNSPINIDNLSTFERTEKDSPMPEEEALLWKTSVLGDVDEETPARTAMGASHVLDFEFINSLGRINDFYTNNNTGTNPFPWLAWNNRPFANRYELTNVPYTSAHWLTRLFGVRSTTNSDTYTATDHSSVTDLVGTSTDLKLVVHPNAAAFPHLLNFEADPLDGSDVKSDRLHQVMDFVEVPSRFAGVFEYVRPGVIDLTDDSGDVPPNAPNAQDDFGYRLSPPFDELSTYRYPGKVNVNTVSTETVWDALLGAKTPTVKGPYATQLTFDDWTAAIDDSPVRPAIATNYVRGTVPGTANAGFFRSAQGDRESGTAAGGETDYRLSYHQDTDTHNNTNRNSYFRNGLRQRLGGVATNRSSVFAIWVTVGYFEWDSENNQLRDLASGGVEYGTETGTVQRSRGFFMFDRSIPMAYEPGENHNIERGILLQSLIE